MGIGLGGFRVTQGGAACGKGLGLQASFVMNAGTALRRLALTGVMVLVGLLPGCVRSRQAGPVAGGGGGSRMSRMTTSQEYWGRTIESDARQEVDGSWSGHALIKASGGADAGAMDAQSFTAKGATEADARAAAVALATAAVDRMRVSHGKP